jgi:hypothetical protein
VGPPDVEARQLAVSAVLLGASAVDVEDALDALSRLRRTLLQVAPLDSPLRESDVRITSVLETPASPEITNVTITIVADDPLRYSAQWQTIANGSNTVINRGGATAWPVIELVGPHPGATIAHPGGVWVMPALAAGVVRTIDCRGGAVRNSAGGRLWSQLASTGPWPRVPPGGTVWTVSGLGAGTARAKRLEAWA